MREIPILFSTPMVQAILDGNKTMTRRVVKPHYRNDEYGFNVCTNKKTGEQWVEKMNEDGGDFENTRYVKCPYGQPGDRLWVRETWYYESHMHDLTAGEPDLPGGLYSHRFVYRASSPDYPVDVGVGEHGWKPSIFMLKVAARIWLEVVSVRVERLQEMNRVAPFLEGCPQEIGGADGDIEAAYLWFRELWDSINAKPKAILRTVGDHTEIISYVSYPWEDIKETREYRGKPWVVYGNPWVWVVEFRRVER